MTQAMDAMVKAMTEEVERQADGHAHETAASSIDMEKVACAGLAAIRVPTVEIILAGADVPDSVQRFWPEMIDAILVP